MSYRLAYFVSHPIQYQAPLLRLIAAQKDIELRVFFYSNFSVRAYQDSEFGRLVEWDTPLTEGYDYQFLNCWGGKRAKSFLQQPIATNITKQLQIRKFDAIWVHGWWQLCSLQAILAAESLKIPILMRGESNGFQQSSHPVKSFIKQVFLQWLFQKISGFLCVGKLNYKFYQSYGISEERLFWMPYAVDNDYFQNQAMLAGLNREELRRSLNLEPGRSIILYAAKLIEKKRPQDLLEAYRLLSPDGLQEPEPYLLFVGDGVLRSQLEAEAKATNWQSIRFLGFRNQSELPALYDLCDVFVLPSSFEPWGLVVNEVMNAAKPVIVSDRVGAAIDLIQHGENGYIFPVGSVKELAAQLRQLLNNPDNAIRMGERSLARIQNWSFAEDYAGLMTALKTVTSDAKK
jgi:glycosyltransferase involved in cell wall biosynthesis